jgi:hypothetical protein
MVIPKNPSLNTNTETLQRLRNAAPTVEHMSLRVGSGAPTPTAAFYEAAHLMVPLLIKALDEALLRIRSLTLERDDAWVVLRRLTKELNAVMGSAPSDAGP